MVYDYLVWIHWRVGYKGLYDKEVLLFDYTSGCRFEVVKRKVACTVLVNAAGLGLIEYIEVDSVEGQFDCIEEARHI